jgi:hypothetical protein
LTSQSLSHGGLSATHETNDDDATIHVWSAGILPARARRSLAEEKVVKVRFGKAKPFRTSGGTAASAVSVLVSPAAFRVPTLVGFFFDARKAQLKLVL